MTLIPPNQDRRITIADIESKFQEFFVLKDKGIVKLALATFVANRLSTVNAPVWLLLVAESSGGKTEIIDMFAELSNDVYKLSYHISDLSPQTFISGMQNQATETSLLHKINGRMVFIKDFTTLLQKNKEARREILAQFREIYDGEFNKDFGTGKSVHWKGRIGIIAGLTPPALETMAQYASMGERFVNYYMVQPSDKELSVAIKANYSKNLKSKKAELASMVATFVSQGVERAEEANLEDQKIDENLMDELNEVAQFATRARSPINTDFKTGEPIGMPSIERFPRFAIQLQNLAKAFVILDENPDGSIGQGDKEILYKIALDSIPRTRRAVLKLLAENRAVSTSAAAAALGFTTPIMRGYLAQLASLSLAVRIPSGGRGNEDAWKMIPKWLPFMKKFEGIEQKDSDMFDEDDVESALEDIGMSDEEREKINDEGKRMQRQAAIAQVMEENNVDDYEKGEEMYEAMKSRQKEIDDMGEDF